MERRYMEVAFFLITLLGTLTVVVLMFLPFMSTLILASILAFLFAGPYESLAKKLGGRRSIAALLVTLLMLVTILVPLALAGWRIAVEAASLYTYLSENTDSGTLKDVVSRLNVLLQRYVPGLHINLADVNVQAQRALAGVVGLLGVVFAGATRLVVGFVLLLLYFFFILRDGRRMKEQFMELSPLTSAREDVILEKIGRAIDSVVRGKIILSVLQGLGAGLGMYLFGVPSPALWGAVTMLASFIPSIGTGLVLTPAVIFLFVTGHMGPAIGLAIWAVFAVGLLDNILGPKLMAAGVNIHPLVMLISVMGGLALFGPIGILLGPIMIALLYALLDIYLSFTRRAGGGLQRKSLQV